MKVLICLVACLIAGANAGYLGAGPIAYAAPGPVAVAVAPPPPVVYTPVVHAVHAVPVVQAVHAVHAVPAVHAVAYGGPIGYGKLGHYGGWLKK